MDAFVIGYPDDNHYKYDAELKQECYRLKWLLGEAEREVQRWRNEYEQMCKYGHEQADLALFALGLLLKQLERNMGK